MGSRINLPHNSRSSCTAYSWNGLSTSTTISFFSFFVDSRFSFSIFLSALVVRGDAERERERERERECERERERDLDREREGERDEEQEGLTSEEGEL